MSDARRRRIRGSTRLLQTEITEREREKKESRRHTHTQTDHSHRIEKDKKAFGTQTTNGSPVGAESEYTTTKTNYKGETEGVRERKRESKTEREIFDARKKKRMI